MKLKDFFLNEAEDPNSKYDNWPLERKKSSPHDTDKMADDPGAQQKKDKKIGVKESRNSGQFPGGNFTKDAAKRSADFKKRWPDSTPNDDDEGEHSPSDDAEALRWKHGQDEGAGDRERPAPDTSGDDPGHEDPMDGNVCPDCKGGNWSSDGSGPCPTCSGMGTSDGSNPKDKEFENIEQWEQEVWDYAQQRYNIPAAKLNSLGNKMDAAFENDVPPEQFVDELMGMMGEAFNSDTQKPSEYKMDKADDEKYKPKEDLSGYADWELSAQGKAKKSGKVSEAHGERAASKSMYKKGPMEKERQDKHKASGEPQVDDPGFAGKDPDEEMFFGGKDQDDYIGTMLDPAAGEEFAGKKVDDFGDEPDDPGFGSDIGPGDVDSTLDTTGGWHHEQPGSDISFPEYEPKELERGSHWWDNKEPEFHPPKNPVERHSDIEKAPSFPDDDPQMADYLRKGGKLGY